VLKLCRLTGTSSSSSHKPNGLSDHMQMETRMKFRLTVQVKGVYKVNVSCPHTRHRTHHWTFLKANAANNSLKHTMRTKQPKWQYRDATPAQASIIRRQRTQKFSFLPPTCNNCQTNNLSNNSAIITVGLGLSHVNGTPTLLRSPMQQTVCFRIWGSMSAMSLT